MNEPAISSAPALPLASALIPLPVYNPSMREHPPLFDFEAQGSLAHQYAEILYDKLKEMRVSGLSANQLRSKDNTWPRLRVFIVGDEEKYRVFFNPQITGVSRETTVMKEGCVTLPDFELALRRPTTVKIQYQNVNGDLVHEEYDGVTARIILHEFDHMVGINFMDHASSFKMQWEIKKYNKRKKKHARNKERAHGK